jgi:hypothetical protein
MLSQIICIDLVGLGEQDAERALLDGLKPSGKPAQPSPFPGKRAEPSISTAPFPPSLARLHGVPELPPHYLPREADLAGLKQKLLAGGANVGITGQSSAVGVQREWATLARPCWPRRWHTIGRCGRRFPREWRIPDNDTLKAQDTRWIFGQLEFDGKKKILSQDFLRKVIVSLGKPPSNTHPLSDLLWDITVQQEAQNQAFIQAVAGKTEMGHTRKNVLTNRHAPFFCSRRDFKIPHWRFKLIKYNLSGWTRYSGGRPLPRALRLLRWMGNRPGRFLRNAMLHRRSHNTSLHGPQR